jgi:4-amino-4-deoxy-L-arabinose transferase-like glycosyltransferase
MDAWFGRLGLTGAERPAVLGLSALLGGLLILRLIVLWATPLELGPDEAQYWFWSQTPAWGYFSKPPMIAWVIGLTSGVCGAEEPCVRLAAPLFHTATAIVLFFLGRTLYGVWVGAMAAAAYATLPGVWLSSTLITTDVPLLFFWSLMLLATVNLLERRSVVWGVVWGLSMGLGLLSKYAMGYALAGVVFALWLTRENPRRLGESDWILGFLLALALLVPNVQWNMAHGFATLKHTASNANWGAENLFNLNKLGEFLGGQIALLGPVLAGLFVWGLARGWPFAGPASQSRAARILLAFALPVLVVVTVQAFISRANANWAAVALAPICVLGAAWAKAYGLRRMFWIGLGINSALGLFLAAMAVSPALVEALNRHNDVKRLRGWNDLANTIVRRAHDGQFDAILSDDREDLASFLYYARDATIPIHSFVPATGPNYEFHLSIPLEKMQSGKVLYLSRQADAAAVMARFANARKIDTISVSLGGTKTRVLNLYELDAPFDPAWSAQKK